MRLGLRGGAQPFVPCTRVGCVSSRCWVLEGSCCVRWLSQAEGRGAAPQSSENTFICGGGAGDDLESQTCNIVLSIQSKSHDARSTTTVHAP